MSQYVNKTNFLRPTTRQNKTNQDQSLQDQDQDQDQSDKTKTGLSYDGCSYNTRTAHHQNSFLSVYLKDCYLTYSKFDNTVLIISTMELCVH